jgi:hypothetical protein
MISKTTMEAFEEGQRSEALPLVMGDIVKVLAGEKKGALAWVISPEEAGESLAYRVEYGDGSEGVHPLRNLQKVDQGEEG